MNGLDRNILLRWCRIRGLLGNGKSLDNINELFYKFEYTSDYDTKYWQWNVAGEVDHYIGGKIHYY